MALRSCSINSQKKQNEHNEVKTQDTILLYTSYIKSKRRSASQQDSGVPFYPHFISSHFRLFFLFRFILPLWPLQIFSVGFLQNLRCPPPPSAASSLSSSLPPVAMELLTHCGYVPEKVLGSGAHGTVIQAHSRPTNGKVAIKVFDVGNYPTREYTSRIKREVASMEMLKGHPNIIEVYDSRMHRGCVLVMMELAVKGDLADLIEQTGRLQENQVKSFFKQLVTGLKHCHNNSIVHGDIKCDNLLIDQEGTLKITDFGFASFQRDIWLVFSCGTHPYAAPEILLRKPYDGFLTDTWSTGVVLYTLAFGFLPFEGDDSKSVLQLIAKGPSYTPDVSAKCQDLIRKILQYNPSERLSLSAILDHPWMNE